MRNDVIILLVFGIMTTRTFQNAGVVVLTNGLVYDFNPFCKYLQIRLGVLSLQKCDIWIY